MVESEHSLIIENEWNQQWWTQWREAHTGKKRSALTLDARRELFEAMGDWLTALAQHENWVSIDSQVRESIWDALLLMAYTVPVEQLWNIEKDGYNPSQRILNWQHMLLWKQNVGNVGTSTEYSDLEVNNAPNTIAAWIAEMLSESAYREEAKELVS